jgi:hypothetical protein
VEDESQLKTLLELDAGSAEFEVWSEGVGLGLIDVRVSPKQRGTLDAGGLSYEVVIDDLQRRIDEVFATADTQGFFDAYRTYDEHVAFLNDLVVAYPTLASMVNLGTSVRGLTLWAIRITGPGDNKPGVMYHGAQHGNEVMGACVVAYMAEYLLTRYDSDPDVQTLVDDVEWFLLPIMNPDGYEEGDRYNANRADLNRNWGGPGCGPNPFSQPETRAMRDFFAAHPNIRAHIDFHTSGYMIMWPWGYTDELCEDNGTFEHVGTEMANLIYVVRGTDYDRRGPVNTTIYPVIGGSVDYCYGMAGLWSITFELGYDHYMPPYEIMPTCQEIAPAMMYLSTWVFDCNENGIPDADELSTGAAEDCNDNLTLDECEIQPDFDGDGAIDVCDADIDDDGVDNDTDQCDYTPRGVPVSTVGRPIGDTNGNCVVDLMDYGRFRNCLNAGGPGVPASQTCLNMFRYDDDTDIDLADFSVFMRSFLPGQ